MNGPDNVTVRSSVRLAYALSLLSYSRRLCAISNLSELAARPVAFVMDSSRALAVFLLPVSVPGNQQH